MNLKRKSLKALGICALVLSTGGCARTEPEGQMHIISRESGSGTQEAFTDLLDISSVKPDAEITNSTAVMIQSVEQDPDALGYVSLGSLSNDVQAIAVDGILPTLQTVEDGSYPVTRPFLVIQRSNETEDSRNLKQDFLAFLESDQAADVIESAGYAPGHKEAHYKQTPNLSQGRLVIGGSSSVTPVMEKLAETYEKLNPSASVEVVQSDSTTGITSVADGTYDLGMSSRDLKEEEKDGLNADVLAYDGIVLIDHPGNPVKELSRKEIGEIYEGTITSWKSVR